MKISEAIWGAGMKITAWCLGGLLFVVVQHLAWDEGRFFDVSCCLAASAGDQGSDENTGDNEEGDSDQEADADDGDDAEGDAGEDDGDEGDEGAEDSGDPGDSGDSDDGGGDENDGEGGDGEDARDNMSDDGDYDDDSEPDELLGICDERIGAFKKMSLDGLCSTGAPTTLKRRAGGIADFTPLIADTTAGRELKGYPDQDHAQPLLPQYAPLPEYEEGDLYVYSDGSWERVVAANHERVEWQNHYGNRSVGIPDFTYKRSEWQTTTRVGMRRFTQTSYLFDEPTTTLWPLSEGNKTRYDEKGKWIGKDGIERIYDSFWRCDVEGRERVRVAAGEFDTWRICCSRFRDSYSFPKSRAREYKTWYYAPSIEHWVLQTRDNRGLRPDSRKELVAVIPDLQKITRTPQALVQIQQQFQEVLETTEENQQDLWMAATGETVVTMIPGRVFEAENGVLCRQYTQEVQAADMVRRYPGIGCRTPEGTWYIPRR